MPDVDIRNRPAIFLFLVTYDGKQDKRPKFTWGLTPDDAIGRAKKAEDTALFLAKRRVRNMRIDLLESLPFNLEKKIFNAPEAMEYRAHVKKWQASVEAADANEVDSLPK